MEIEIKKTRNLLPKYFKSIGFKTGAEVGVYKAEFTEKFCQEGLKMFAIDPWMSFDGQGRTQKIQERQNFLYSHAKRQLDKYDCQVIRSSSMDALKYFKDEELDFVYIDGNHDFKHVAEDIFEWSKKVKKGGVVSGHDYWTSDKSAFNVICHVAPVVDAYSKVFETNLQIIGLEDKCLSWLWIKQ